MGDVEIGISSAGVALWISEILSHRQISLIYAKICTYNHKSVLGLIHNVIVLLRNDTL